jgi:hypothetical protein
MVTPAELGERLRHLEEDGEADEGGSKEQKQALFLLHQALQHASFESRFSAVSFKQVAERRAGLAALIKGKPSPYQAALLALADELSKSKPA